MQIKLKKLSDNAIVPTKGTLGSAGFDLVATSMDVVNLPEYGYIEYGTGISVKIPDNHVGLLFSRSSISNTGLILANAVGVIDNDYRGEIKLRFKYIEGTTHYNIGDKVGQILFVKLPSITFKEVDSLDETSRGEGGFGSTDDLIY